MFLVFVLFRTPCSTFYSAGFPPPKPNTVAKPFLPTPVRLPAVLWTVQSVPPFVYLVSSQPPDVCFADSSVYLVDRFLFSLLFLFSCSFYPFFTAWCFPPPPHPLPWRWNCSILSVLPPPQFALDGSTTFSLVFLPLCVRTTGGLGSGFPRQCICFKVGILEKVSGFFPFRVPNLPQPPLPGGGVSQTPSQTICFLRCMGPPSASTRSFPFSFFSVFSFLAVSGPS